MRSPTEEAAICRETAKQFVGKPEASFLLQLASAFDELALKLRPKRRKPHVTESELLKRGTKIVMDGEEGVIAEVRQFASAGAALSCPYRVQLVSGHTRWVGRDEFHVIQLDKKGG